MAKFQRVLGLAVTLVATLAMSATTASANEAETANDRTVGASARGNEPSQRDYGVNVSVINTDGSTLNAVFVRHTHAGNRTNFGPRNLSPGESAGPFRVTTDDDGRHDYWFVSFFRDGDLYKTKDNFYCDLDEKDSGGTVTIGVSRNGVTVTPPVTSSCWVSVSQ